MNNVQFSPSELRRCARGISEVLTDFSSTLSNVESTLDGLNRCWGVKSVGQKFEAEYLPPATKARDGLTGYEEFLGNFADALNQTADSYEATECEATI